MDSAGNSAYNTHFESTCYNLLPRFNRDGDCQAASVRPANFHGRPLGRSLAGAARAGVSRGRRAEQNKPTFIRGSELVVRVFTSEN